MMRKLIIIGLFYVLFAGCINNNPEECSSVKKEYGGWTFNDAPNVFEYGTDKYGDYAVFCQDGGDQNYLEKTKVIGEKPTYYANLLNISIVINTSDYTIHLFNSETKERVRNNIKTSKKDNLFHFQVMGNGGSLTDGEKRFCVVGNPYLIKEVGMQHINGETIIPETTEDDETCFLIPAPEGWHSLNYYFTFERNEIGGNTTITIYRKR